MRASHLFPGLVAQEAHEGVEVVEAVLDGRAGEAPAPGGLDRAARGRDLGFKRKEGGRQEADAKSG